MQAVEPVPQVQVLERGSLLFLYRPKASVAHAHGAADIEQLYFMLMPDDREDHKSRVYLLSQTSLPASSEDGPILATAVEVDSDPRVALDNLEEETAKAPGRAARPWAPIAGEGRYAIFKHVSSTYLAYGLDRPEQPGEVQQALHLAKQGNLLISVKPPAAPSQPGQATQPLYPSRLKSLLQAYGEVPVEPSDFMDYQGTQVVLKAANSAVKHQWGLRLEQDGQNQRERQAFQLLHKEERRAAREGIALLEPMEEGLWV